MAHTNKTVFNDTNDVVEGLTVVAENLVFQGNYPSGSQWIEFTLTTPFLYNGEDNLVVQICQTAFTCTFCAFPVNWHTTAIGENRYGFRNDVAGCPPATNFANLRSWRPNTRFTFEAAQGPVGCSVIPEVIIPGQSAILSATPFNPTHQIRWYTGTPPYGDVFITAVSDPWELSVSPESSTTYFARSWDGVNESHEVCIVTLTVGPYVEIGVADTDELNSHAPNPFYRNMGMFSQAIYLQSEIGEADTINRIAWHLVDDITSGLGVTFDLYLGHTPDDSYPNGLDFKPLGTLVGSNLVFEPYVLAGWVEFELDTSFEYTGTDNLVVTVCQHQATGNGQNAFWYGSSTEPHYRSTRNPSTGDCPPSVGNIEYERPDIRFYKDTGGVPDPTPTSVPTDTPTPEPTDTPLPGTPTNTPIATWTPGPGTPTATPPIPPIPSTGPVGVGLLLIALGSLLAFTRKRSRR
jgi:hypothetical protein